MHPLATKSRAHISAWETLEHPWLGPGAIDRGGRSPLALRANPRLHPSRWEGPCPLPPCSHPTHPPTVQPQLLGAGSQGNGGQVGACCGRRALCNPLPAATPLPCRDLAARTLPLPPHRCPHGVGAAQVHQPGMMGGCGVRAPRACVHRRALQSAHTLAGESRAPKGISNDWGKRMMILGPNFAQIRAPVRKRSAICGVTDKIFSPMLHPLAGCRPQWQGKKQADFRRPLGFEWRQTAQRAGGYELCPVPLWT